MNYFGRLSTANTLTHYGKKGMKWKKRKDPLTGETQEVANMTYELNPNDTVGIIEYDVRKTNKAYRNYEKSMSKAKKNWKSVKDKNKSFKQRAGAAKQLVKNGYSAMKNKRKGKMSVTHVIENY